MIPTMRLIIGWCGLDFVAGEYENRHGSEKADTPQDVDDVCHLFLFMGYLLFRLNNVKKSWITGVMIVHKVGSGCDSGRMKKNSLPPLGLLFTPILP